MNFPLVLDCKSRLMKATSNSMNTTTNALVLIFVLAIHVLLLYWPWFVHSKFETKIEPCKYCLLLSLCTLKIPKSPPQCGLLNYIASQKAHRGKLLSIFFLYGKPEHLEQAYTYLGEKQTPHRNLTINCHVNM